MTGPVNGAPTGTQIYAAVQELLAGQRDQTERLARIEARQDAMAEAAEKAARAPRPQHSTAHVAPRGGGEVAADSDLDGKYGNPEIRFDPKRWTGQSYVGSRFSDCPAEYLDEVASFNDWRASKDEEKGDPKAKWPRLDAARARGWAARIRANGGAAHRPPANELHADADPMDDVPF